MAAISCYHTFAKWSLCRDQGNLKWKTILNVDNEDENDHHENENYDANNDDIRKRSTKKGKT